MVSGLRPELVQYAASTRDSQCDALREVVEQGDIIAYEVDGYGSKCSTDDTNIPSLLSLPVLGYMSRDNALYRVTGDYVLSLANPYYFEGPEGSGVGGPHEGYNMSWPMAVITSAMTSDDDAEIKRCLDLLKETTRRTGFIHEAFSVNDVNDYTRSWFAWANGLFGEHILQLVYSKPHLLIKNDPVSIA